MRGEIKITHKYIIQIINHETPWAFQAKRPR